ncbi:3D (Asp-Asp-Asp) domain-containing protein [Ureibacillus xyleni]|uniref:3D (Asp-Asp-Asp) domain-containing protein n=1 Tax=Ureibacillus xyleni TaxID=614648 RepID=A0A285SC37_9BACL|nr:3D domain-containing protein [Ureibacillus xyleni]SOC05289.1 3D (Asp-Asp-Asp) domain-containing protein [Ureibacillus xyleni]
MKIKLTLSMLVLLFIALSLTTNVKAVEIGRTIMHTSEGGEKKIINEIIDAFFFDKAHYKNMIFYKTVQPQKYEVQKGDNLYRIALKHNVELSDLMSWNNKTDSLIHPGEELIIKENGNRAEEESIPSEAPVVQEQPSEKEVQAVVSEQETEQVSEENTEAIAEVEKEIVPEENSEEVEAASVEMTVTATAYTAYCEGCSGTTAIGIDLRANPNQKVIAVDPNVIPLGSKVWVEGYGEAVAGDTGGAIKGNKIDVFIPSYDQAMAWGRKTVKVKILN